MEAASTSSSVTSGGGEGGAAVPQPAPMPTANAPPPFLVKTYDMVDDPSTDKGFRKVDPDRWEFANEGFLRGQKHLLKSINRRKPAHGHLQHQQQPSIQAPAVGACVEVGKFGLEEEVERLKRDKNVLMQELVRLRQQQQSTDGQLQTMVQRLQGMEQRQQQMMSFLAKAMNSPGFLAQFMQQPNDSNRRITEGNKKRRLKQDGVADDSVSPSDGQIIKYQPLMNEAAKAMFRQIMKHDSSPRLENIGNTTDNFLIGDRSSSSNELECGSSTNNVSGVTLQEVPLTTGPAFVPSCSAIMGSSSAGISEVQTPSIGACAEVANIQFPGGSPAIVDDPISLPPADAMIPELSRIVHEGIVDIMGSETRNGIFTDPTSLTGGDKIPFEMGGFSPDAQIEWDMPELPPVSDAFWEKFLQSPPPVDTEMHSALTEDLPEENETNPLDNGWDRSEHMAQLTEQMGLLSQEAKKD